MHLLERPIQRLASSRLARAATWPHGVDGYTGLVAPAWSVDRVRARITALHRQTTDTITVTLRPNGNWQGHRAGQHVLLTVEVAGVRQTRCFSVASAEGSRDVELTCKAGPASVVSRHLRDTAEVGDLLELSQAQGDFVLPAAPGPLVLISAGSGITPVLSMLRTLDAAGHEGAVTFLHYARSADDVLYGDDLRAIAARRPDLRVVVVTEDGSGPEGQASGRFDPAHLPAVDGHAFVCGPAPFMDLVEAAWLDGDGDPAAFHTERFGPAAPASTGSSGGSRLRGGGPHPYTLRFARSGVEVVDDGRCILEQAEAAGLRPTHGCRMGICHTCVVPDADGTPVRICVTTPAGDLTLDL